MSDVTTTPVLDESFEAMARRLVDEALLQADDLEAQLRAHCSATQRLAAESRRSAFLRAIEPAAAAANADPRAIGFIALLAEKSFNDEFVSKDGAFSTVWPWLPLSLEEWVRNLKGTEYSYLFSTPRRGRSRR